VLPPAVLHPGRLRNRRLRRCQRGRQGRGRRDGQCRLGRLVRVNGLVGKGRHGGVGGALVAVGVGAGYVAALGLAYVASLGVEGAVILAAFVAAAINPVHVLLLQALVMGDDSEQLARRRVCGVGVVAALLLVGIGRHGNEQVRVQAAVNSWEQHVADNVLRRPDRPVSNSLVVVILEVMEQVVGIAQRGDGLGGRERARPLVPVGIVAVQRNPLHGALVVHRAAAQEGARSVDSVGEAGLLGERNRRTVRLRGTEVSSQRDQLARAHSLDGSLSHCGPYQWNRLPVKATLA